MLASGGDANASGAARRRRERRLRQFLRHERLSVAMAMAESTHHAAHGDRGWPGPESGYEMHCTAKLRKNPPTQEPGTRYFGLDDDDSVPEFGGTRPDRPAGVGPQERSRSSTPLRLCRCSMFLCRWWDSCWERRASCDLHERVILAC